MIDFKLTESWTDIKLSPLVSALGDNVNIQNKTGGVITVHITDTALTTEQKLKSKRLGFSLNSGDSADFSLTKSKAYINGAKDSYLFIQSASASSGSGPAAVQDAAMASKTEEIKIKLEDIKSLLSSLNGNTDLVETLQTQLKDSVVVLQDYVDGVEGLLTSIGNNSDGLESLLDAIGIKNDGIKAALLEIRDRLPATLGIKNNLQSLSVAISTDQFDLLSTRSLQTDIVEKLENLEEILNDTKNLFPLTIGQKDNTSSLAVSLSIEQQGILQTLVDKLPSSLGTKINDESLAVTLCKQDRNLFDNLATTDKQNDIIDKLEKIREEASDFKHQSILQEQLPNKLGQNREDQSVSVILSSDQSPVFVREDQLGQLSTEFVNSNASGSVNGGFKYASIANTGNGVVTITNPSNSSSFSLSSGSSIMIPVVAGFTHQGFNYSCSSTTIVGIIGR